MHNFNPATMSHPPAYFNFSFEVVNGSVHDVKNKIDTFLHSPIFAMFPEEVMKSFSIIEDGNKINFALMGPSKISSEFAPFKDILDTVQCQLKVDQSVEVSLRLAASPKKLLAEGAEPFILQLLSGISIDIKLHVWKKVADLLLKLIENGQLPDELMPMIGGITPAFLLKLNAKLDITVDDYMKQKLTENPLVEPVLMDAKTLIDSTSG